MDIAEVRNLAQERGLTEDEFAKVWETEQKIRLLKDENKALEVKLAGRKLQGLVSSEPTQAAASDVLPLPKHSEMHEQPLLELRKQLQQQNHCHIQEMATLVKKQDISLSQVVKRELSRAVIERKKAVSCEFESNSFDACSERSHSTVTGSQKSVLQPVKTNEKLGKPNTQSQTVKQKQQTKKEDNKINDYYSHMPKPATDSALPVSSQKSYEATSCLLGNGNTLRVPKAKEFAASNDLAFSNYHILSKCPCKVRLCLWFGSKKELNVHILLHGIEDKPLDRPTVFKGAGFILHKSGSFSPLFEATSQELMELTSATDLHIIASVQLKTNSLKSNNVSLKLLEQRDFTIDNSLSIKWFVTAETSN